MSNVCQADGFNHFVCPKFPAHSHWSMDGNKVYINWGSYGEYELEVAFSKFLVL